MDQRRRQSKDASWRRLSHSSRARSWEARSCRSFSRRSTALAKRTARAPSSSEVVGDRIDLAVGRIEPGESLAPSRNMVELLAQISHRRIALAPGGGELVARAHFAGLAQDRRVLHRFRRARSQAGSSSCASRCSASFRVSKRRRNSSICALSGRGRLASVSGVPRKDRDVGRL